MLLDLEVTCPGVERGGKFLVPQITVSVVRQTAHNVHVACIASCIHVTKNSNNAIPLLALRRASHTQL